MFYIKLYDRLVLTPSNFSYFFGAFDSASNVTPLVWASEIALTAAAEKRPRLPTVMPCDFRNSRFVAI